MTFLQDLLVIFALIIASAFFAIAEISLAASRRVRLRQLADDGDARAERVLTVQEQPGYYFTAVQVGVNAIAILAGVVGEGSLSPWLDSMLSYTSLPGHLIGPVSATLSFVLVTSCFILFADLLPKRIGMTEPEVLAVWLIGPMHVVVRLLMPLVWLYSRTADLFLRLWGIPTQRDDRVTPDDILSLAEAGAQSGTLDRSEQQVIENVFELDSITVASAMTTRDRIAWFDLNDSDALIRARITEEPFSTYPVVDGDLDHVVGYVDAKDLFQRALKNEPLSLHEPNLLHKVLIVPDQLTLSEVLTQFRQVHEDFAVVINEYSIIVGVVTLNDVMSTVMGDLVSLDEEELIVRRDDNSWLIDGITPISDVMRALGIDSLPHEGSYETLAGFLMTMLRRLPKRTDCVQFENYTFEVMDVDSYRIDQVMVTRTPEASATTAPLSPLAALGQSSS
mgnify:CR=1 FL=1